MIIAPPIGAMLVRMMMMNMMMMRCWPTRTASDSFAADRTCACTFKPFLCKMLVWQLWQVTKKKKTAPEDIRDAASANSPRALRRRRRVDTEKKGWQSVSAPMLNENRHTSSKQIGHRWSLSGVFQSLYFPVSKEAITFSGVARGFASPSVWASEIKLSYDSSKSSSLWKTLD